MNTKWSKILTALNKNQNMTLAAIAAECAKRGASVSIQHLSRLRNGQRCEPGYSLGVAILSIYNDSAKHKESA